jgi:flagellar biosynthetic protein FliR
MEKLVTFLLVLARVAGIFTLAPIFGNQNVNRYVRVTIAVSLAFIFLPMAKFDVTNIQPISFFAAIVKETLVGVLMGYLASMMFTAIQMAGSYIDLSMGLGFAQQVDPMTKERSSPMGQLQNMVATLVFLGVNGHHMMVRGLAESFALMPLGTMTFSPEVAKGILGIFSTIILTALKIASPVIGVIFITDVALGILARTVPQLNIFNVGFPVKLSVGLMVVSIVIPATAGVMISLFSGLHRDLVMLLRHLV